ncbi:MAG: hypothetical protein MZV63_46840 [Marinilabiliales bacterium]|nr:hypothetical protein [Marinilabiliales bacterium]
MGLGIVQRPSTSRLSKLAMSPPYSWTDQYADCSSSENETLPWNGYFADTIPGAKSSGRRPGSFLPEIGTR